MPPLCSRSGEVGYEKAVLFYLLLLALLLLSLAAAAPDEAVGRVIKVVDGDTIDVQLQSHDSRISEDTIRVRLADLDSPEMSTPQGPPAKDYATKWLQSATVSLDLDDKTGKDPYGRWVAVVYLQKPDGSLQNFNKMLVEADQACVWDFNTNPVTGGAGRFRLASASRERQRFRPQRPRPQLRAMGLSWARRSPTNTITRAAARPRRYRQQTS